MLVNAFKMRRDVKSYHLGCMACAAGALGINLLRDLLKVTVTSYTIYSLYSLEAGEPALAYALPCRLKAQGDS